MSGVARSFEGLDALRKWLLEQMGRISPEQWEQLCAELKAWMESLKPLIDQGAEVALVSQLAAIGAQHGIRLWAAPPDLLGPEEVYRSHAPRETAHAQTSHTMSRSVEEAKTGELLGQIARLLSFRRAPMPLATYPEARIPTEVDERVTFQVAVAAHAKPTPYTTAQISLSRRTARPIDLEVELILPEEGTLRAQGPTTAVLRIQEDGNAAALCFDVFAAEAGAHRVEVSLRSGGIERARLGGLVLVRTREQREQTPNSPAVISISGPGLANGSPHSGLLLHAELRGVSADYRFFRVTLSGDQAVWSGPQLEGRIELPLPIARLLGDLCRDVSSISELDKVDARELRLRAVGIALSRQLLPVEIREVLTSGSWPEHMPLHIESNDAQIPWEGLWLGTGTQGQFLGERFAVTRWLRKGSVRDVVGGDLVVLVSPRSSGLQIAIERSALHALAGVPPEELSQLHEVQRLLMGNSARGVLHFACHGDSQPNTTFGETLLMDGGPLSVVDVVAPERGQRGPLDGALVFVNACRANRAERTLWGSQGWSGKFLDAGAGAFIAPAWTVSDVGAGRFAEAFYRSAAAGHPLGEAARRARIHAARQGDPDRLGYALYASPNARLAGAAMRVSQYLDSPQP